MSDARTDGKKFHYGIGSWKPRSITTIIVLVTQPDHLRRHRRQRLPPGDAANTRPRLRVVGDAEEPSAQFDRSRQFALLLIDGADRGGIGFCHEKHGHQHNSRGMGRNAILCVCKRDFHDLGRVRWLAIGTHQVRRQATSRQFLVVSPRLRATAALAQRRGIRPGERSLPLRVRTLHS
jgi:hypothetical protein